MINHRKMRNLLISLGAVAVLGTGSMASFAQTSSAWVQSGNNWWYRHADGTYMTNGWEDINGTWYYFDHAGWMHRGWIQIVDTWYYLKPDGAMATGWCHVGGQDYYFNEDGSMAHDQWIGKYHVGSSGAWDQTREPDGWIQSGNNWWYRHADGSYTTNGWENIDNQWYYFDGAGWMYRGWLQLGESWYYMGMDGSMATGWNSVNGTLYYMDESGSMLTGWKEISGRWYYLEETGALNDHAIPLEEEYEVQEDIQVEAVERVRDSIIQSRAMVEEFKQENQSMKTFPYDRGERKYDTLSNDQKAIYDEMLSHVQALEPLEYTAAEDGYYVMDNALIAMGAIFNDYPQCETYFYLEDICEGDMTTALRVCYFMPGDATMSPVENIEMLRRELAVFNVQCDEIIRRMPENLSAYDKYRYLAFIISFQTTYDYSNEGAWQDKTIYGSIESGYSVCQGYAVGFRYLCSKADLYCDLVLGHADGDNMGHMWNLVKLEDGTYHVDVTWCDSVRYPTDWTWYNYFMCSQKAIEVDHVVDDGTVATGKTEFPIPGQHDTEIPR